MGGVNVVANKDAEVDCLVYQFYIGPGFVFEGEGGSVVWFKDVKDG